jgi:hypothetical protein
MFHMFNVDATKECRAGLRQCGKTGMEPNGEQPPQDQNDPRFIARGLFKELCALYPDRYIALIEPPPLLSTELATPKVPAAPQKPTL